MTKRKYTWWGEMNKFFSAMGIGLCILAMLLGTVLCLIILASMWPGYFTIGLLCFMVLAVATAIGNGVLGDD